MNESEPKPCAGPDLGYRAWHADADHRHRNGERQVWCPTCQIWAWPDHVAPGHQAKCLTDRQFTALMRRLEREEARRREQVDLLEAQLENGGVL